MLQVDKGEIKLINGPLNDHLRKSLIVEPTLELEMMDKKKELLGFYLFKFNDTNPLKFEEITVWNSKLDIDNCTISILRGHDRNTK